MAEGKHSNHMDNAQSQFDDAEQALLETARRETEAEDAARLAAEADPDAGAESADTPDAEPAPKPAAPAPAAPDAPNAPAPAQEPGAQAPAPTPDAQGSTKAALRASRRAEKILRDRVESLEREMAEFKASGKKPEAANELDESQLNDVREYAPEVGKRFDAMQAELAELRKRPAAAAEPKAFVPEAMPEDVQEGIDEVPDLLLWWSHEEHQDKWEAAKDADRLLARSPKWQGKPLAERFAAAVDMVKSTVVATPSKASSPKTLEDAQRVIANSKPAAAGPVGVGDLRGGATPANRPESDPKAMAKAGKSDEEIMAALPQLP